MSVMLGSLSALSVGLGRVRAHRAEAAFVIGILALAALLMPIRTASLGDAASNNLANGLSLLERGEPLFFSRGPVYYGMIALSFKLFGVSVEHAVWVTRLFVPLNIGLVYLVTRSMLNRTAAVVAALLVFFSWPLNVEAAKLELDNVLPFFMLLSLWLSWLAAKRQSVVLAISAGSALGVAWLTKETAMLFLPLFFIPLIVRDYRTRRSAILGCVSLAAFFATLLPWVLYGLSNGSSLATHLGAASPEVLRRGHAPQSSYLGLVTQYLVVNGPANLWSYFTDYFRSNFAIWLPLLLGLIYAFGSAYRKRSLELIFLLGGIVLFATIAVYQGQRGERLGQNYIVFLLLYIVLAYGLADAAQVFANRVTLVPRNVATLGLSGVVALLLMAQLFNPLNGFHKSTMGLWMFSDRRSPVVNDVMRALPADKLTTTVRALGFPQFYVDKWENVFDTDPSEPRFVVGQRFDDGVRDASNWMVKNIPAGTRLLMSGPIHQSADFYTRFRYPMASYGSKIAYRIASQDGVSLKDHQRGPLYGAGGGKIAHEIPLDDGAASEIVDPGRLLGVATFDAFRRNNLARLRMIILHFEGLLLDRINVVRPLYIVLFRSPFEEQRAAQLYDLYDRYFRDHPQTETVFQNQMITIFRVDSLPMRSQEGQRDLYFNPSFGEDLAWLSINFRSEYANAIEVLEELNVRY